jgi:DNA sulfur modification protein DndB
MKIPAIQGRIGTTTYYTANLSFLQVSEIIKRIDGELHTSSSLKEQIQRSLTDNYSKIKDYILNKEDHFFNSLVLAIYDGEPKWTEIRYEIDEEQYYNVGLLELNGEEKIFPVDGQHRVEGIKAALAIREELQYETIPAMIISHSNTPQGMERSRRIFSTLNRYAKPVRLGDIIALDEDDAVAIVTRDLLENYPLFMNDRIKATNSKSIPPGDKMAFTSLMTLYSCHFELYKAFMFEANISDAKAKDSLKIRPSDSTLDSLKAYITEFWDIFISTFNELEEYINNHTNTAASEFRSRETGGNILFRPVSLYPLVQVISRIHKKNGIEYRDIFNKFSQLDRCVSSGLWNKIIWNPNTNKMIVKNQTAIKLLLLYVYDHETLSVREKTDLIDRYALLLGINQDDVEPHIEQYKL